MTNNGCKRYCDVMNRPAYIVLFKGDDSDFEGNQSVDIVIDTELDTTGMKAHFRFMDFVQDFYSIPENKTLSLVFPNAKTSEFPLGAADATLRFEDASGKFRTISNRIHIVVTNSVHEAYDNEDSQSITVTVKGTVTWEMIEGKPTFSTVATSGSYNDLTDKPTIPAPITIDPALSQTSENPVQNKVVSKALYTGFTPWVCEPAEYDGKPVEVVFYHNMMLYVWQLRYVSSGEPIASLPASINSDKLVLDFSDVGITATRHLITPTKTSQLMNDGAPNGGGTPYATTAQVAGKQDALSSAQMDAVNSGATAAKVATWDGYAAQIAAKANASDVNAALAQKASLADLPYAMVTPGEWEFSELPSGYSDPVCEWNSSESVMLLTMQHEGDDFEIGNYDVTQDSLSVTFAWDEGPGTETYTVTATRASLPGHLLDRAGNRVVVSGATTLTLPAANPGYLRDFLVRLEISGSTVPTITFAAPTGETITYETDGDEFPVPDEAGTWLYSFTESCVSHKFAVSLKKVNEVAAPQAQGGS